MSGRPWIGPVSLALALLATGARASQDDGELLTARDATLESRPAEAAIGEPVEWTLSIWHERGDDVLDVPEDPAPDASWVLLDGPQRETVRAEGRELTRVRWRLLSLEPGERALPTLAVETEGGEHIEATPGTLVVRGELRPDEDAPRPLAGFHPIEDRALAFRPLHLGLLLLVALIAGAVLWLRRRRGTSAPVGPTPLERLASLEARGARASDDPGGARDLLFDLSHLVREAVDTRLGSDLAPLTDEEWIERVRARGLLSGEAVDALERLFEESREVKYGGSRPTRFAVNETVGRARGVLEGLRSQEVAA